MFASALLRHGHLGRWAAIGFLLWLMGVWLSGAPARGKHDGQAAELFSAREIPRLVIEIPDEEMAELRSQTRQHSRNPTRRNVWVTVREGGNLYTNVALQTRRGQSRPDQDAARSTSRGPRHARQHRIMVHDLPARTRPLPVRRKSFGGRSRSP